MHVSDSDSYQAVYGDCCLSRLTHAHFTLSSLQVRVFTYLIGREMTFADNVKWIACNNKGKKNKKQNKIKFGLIIRPKVRESALWHKSC